MSVIVPVFNTEPYLDEALMSIRRQTLQEIEILCIDDASTDGSREAVREHAAQDSRIRFFGFESNRGLGAVRNFGLTQATGKYIYFFDSDDVLEASALQRLLERAETSGLDAVFFNARPLIDESADPNLLHRYERQYRRTHDYQQGLSGSDLMRQMTKNGEWKPSACLYLTRKELLSSAALSFSEGVLHEDNGFTMRMMLAVERTGYDEAAYFVRRVRSDSITTSAVTSAHIRGLVVAVSELLLAQEPFGGDRATAAAISVQAELLFSDAVAKYRKLSGEERRDFLEWVPDSAVQLFMQHQLPQHVDRLEATEALESRADELSVLQRENAAYRDSRVLRIARRVRSLLPPYRRQKA